MRIAVVISIAFAAASAFAGESLRPAPDADSVSPLRPSSVQTASAHIAEETSDAPLIELDGSISISPDGSELSYRWTQVSGPGVTLSDSGSARPQFRTNTPGTYEFQLVVSSNGLNSEPYIVRLEIERENLPPVAQVNLQEIWGRVGQELQVDGSSSFDPEGELLEYQWSIVTPGLMVPEAALRKPVLVVEPTADGLFEVELTVSDGEKTSAPVRTRLGIKPRPVPPVAQARIVTVTIPAGASATSASGTPMADLAAMAAPRIADSSRLRPDADPVSVIKVAAPARVAPPVAQAAAQAVTPPPPASPQPTNLAPLPTIMPPEPSAAPAPPPSLKPAPPAVPALQPPPDPISPVSALSAEDPIAALASTLSIAPEPAPAPIPVPAETLRPDPAPLPQPQRQPPPRQPQYAQSPLHRPQPSPFESPIEIPAMESGGMPRGMPPPGMPPPRTPPRGNSPMNRSLLTRAPREKTPVEKFLEIPMGGAAAPASPAPAAALAAMEAEAPAGQPVPGVPIAVVTAPTHALAGSLVRMDATRSHDPGGNSLVYRWRQTGGPRVTTYIMDERLGNAAPGFEPAEPGLYSFALTVFNGASSSDPVDIDIAVSPAPFVTPPSPVNAPSGDARRADPGLRRVPELAPLPNSQPAPTRFPRPRFENARERPAAKVLLGEGGR